MKRHYFICDDLGDMKSVQTDLEANGIAPQQIHVLTQREAEVTNRGLYGVMSFFKQDVVHSTLFGAVIGAVLSVVLLSLVYVSGLATTTAGWTPFVFLAVVLLGFCTWEGGLRGIQEPHYHYRRFQKDMENGHSVIFVDVDEHEENTLRRVVSTHNCLSAAGVEPGGSRMRVSWQQKYQELIKALP